MKLFSSLYRELESSTRPADQLKALVKYLTKATEEDRLWAIALFTDRRPKRKVQISDLKLWADAVSDLPPWLLQESYDIVGDLAETISLVLSNPIADKEHSLSVWIQHIIDQKDKSEKEKKDFVQEAWRKLNQEERFVFNKLISGSFRIRISQKIVIRAVAQVIEEDQSKVAHRLLGDWSPLTTTYKELIGNANWENEISKPYAFHLPRRLEDDITSLGEARHWLAEWAWDGIRLQLIKRNQEIFLWSEDEELITNTFPEFKSLSNLAIDGFVIDCTLVIFKDGIIQPFNHLQKRMGRRTVSKKLLLEYPAVIFAGDLLEYNGKDIRKTSLSERRKYLEELVAKIHNKTPGLVYLSDSIGFSSWKDLTKLRQRARSKNAAGIILKLKSGSYKNDDQQDEWWQWKLEPHTIEAVLLYVQRGDGRGSNTLSEFTFAVWNKKEKLVPIVRVNNTLTDEETIELAQFAKKNTIEKFGPVRSIKPELVFELSFESICESKRHKSGLMLKVPIIKHWLRKKSATEAGTLADLRRLL